MSTHWTVYAVKYAERNTRIRADSFIFDEAPGDPHEMDYFLWALVSDQGIIVVDTGYDAEEAARRDRPLLRDPAQSLEAVGIDAEAVDTVIITHLHYDHAGSLMRFPNATFHVQAAEMAFATGPCMCEMVLGAPYTGAHICQMVERVYSGRVIFHDGAAEVAPGVRVHMVGGHSKGMQVVEVETADGPLCLASDATHYYANFLTRIPFPVVVDLPEMFRGFDLITELAGGASRVIPGHDPLVRDLFPAHGTSGFAWRLDKGLIAKLPEY